VAAQTLYFGNDESEHLPREVTVFCPRCGTPAHADLRFCTACGAPLIPSAPAGPAGPPSQTPEAPAAAVERKSALTTRVAIGVTLLVVLIAAAAAAYLLYRGSSAGGGDLRVVNVAFRQSEDGPPRADAPYASGDTVYVKYEVLGFAKDKEDKIDLLLRVVARDPDNLGLYPPWEKELVQEVPRGRPVNGWFHLGLQPYAPGGAYKVEIQVHDKVKNTDAATTPMFHVEHRGSRPRRGWRCATSRSPCPRMGRRPRFPSWKVAVPCTSDGRSSASRPGRTG